MSALCNQLRFYRRATRDKGAISGRVHSQFGQAQHRLREAEMRRGRRCIAFHGFDETIVTPYRYSLPIGRIERTLFILDWLQNVELRRLVHVGLNKGEARNALARSVFFYRLGEIRDRSFEAQRYRASGLMVTAAIVLWNTVYLDRAIHAMDARGAPADAVLLPYLSPLGWEHINLTGDYVWRQNHKLQAGSFRPLRPLPET
jgi:hypothetical protein